MTTSAGAPASATSTETSESATSTTLSTMSAQPIPSPSVTASKSASDTKPLAVPVTDAPVRPLQQLQQQQPPRVPILPAVLPSSTSTKASIVRASAATTSSASSNGNSSTRITPSAVSGAMETMNPVAGIAPSIGATQALQPMANKTAGNALPPAAVQPSDDRSDHEAMWDRAPDFDELLSDSDDLNAHPGHSGSLESNAPNSFYHGFLNSSATRSSPAMIHNPNETQQSIVRQASSSSSSSKSFTPVEHRPSQNPIPPRHPMPMAPPYLPPTMPPYGMPSPYPWMPSMPPPWMQPMGPMGRMSMDSFSDAFSSQSDSTDFGNEMNFDDLGSDDRSFSSLLLGSDSDDIGLGGRRGAKSIESARASTSGYRQSPSMPYSSSMGGYPYAPYPYNMSQGGYYPPLPPVPPHHSSNPSSQGTSSSLNRGYIPMHYPTPMSASHMGLHPGYMGPGMMPTYDMSATASSAGRSGIPGIKNEFDLKDN